MSATFNCPFCGAPISGAESGSTFMCPYCRAKVVAPHAGPVSFHWDGGASAEPSDAAFADGTGEVVVTVDPQLGFLAIGVHAPHGRPPMLRCWDVKHKKPLWDVLQGQTWLDKIERDCLAIRGKNVYVANKRHLLCLDLARGTQKWTATLSDKPSGSDDNRRNPGIGLADPFPAGQRGAILVPTIDNGLFAFDRDSGQLLWNRSFGEHAVEVTPVPDLGACVVRRCGSYVKCEIVNPAYPQPIASLGDDHWSTDLGRLALTGRTVLTVAEDMGSEGDDDGLLCFDSVTGQVHFFDKVEDLEDDVIPCAMGSRVFAAVDDGSGLYVGPRGRTMPCPVPNHVIAGLLPAGPTLALLLKKSHGTPVRRVVGLDPASLAFRFDAGEAGSEPDDDWERHMVSDGYSLVYVATPDDDEDNCELRSIDTTTGRRIWSKPIGCWRAHRFVNGALVVWTPRSIEAIAPQNGQVLGRLE